mmetsp:Transcript_65994/g.154414  ORF Transcript_65994/g.154414 Transcript_65994/m.154414 type:complete len:97 (-) Transcript_65994:1585-1875(-)
MSLSALSDPGSAGSAEAKAALCPEALSDRASASTMLWVRRGGAESLHALDCLASEDRADFLALSSATGSGSSSDACCDELALSEASTNMCIGACWL